jgi:hypothetical protein
MIAASINCLNVSMSRFFVSKYNISGTNKPVPIGNSVTVRCGKNIQVSLLPELILAD